VRTLRLAVRLLTENIDERLSWERPPEGITPYPGSPSPAEAGEWPAWRVWAQAQGLHLFTGPQQEFGEALYARFLEGDQREWKAEHDRMVVDHMAGSTDEYLRWAAGRGFMPSHARWFEEIERAYEAYGSVVQSKRKKG
jgi:hypothetical protein